MVYALNPSLATGCSSPSITGFCSASNLTACAVRLVILGLLIPDLVGAQSLLAAVRTQSRDLCVIVDNDFNIDDMQAIPLVLGAKHVAAIVQSEGYTLPERAAPAVNALVNQIPGQQGNRHIPIIVGGRKDQSANLKSWPWLPFFRSMMNVANGLLPSVPEPWPHGPAYPERVTKAVDHCKSVEVLIIGTYTSFRNYAPLIARKISRVVIMGQPIGDETSTPGRESFNCSYDFEACKSAMILLASFNAFFVDIPRLQDCRDTPTPASHCYNPSLEMVLGEQQADGRWVGGLVNQGLPGQLKRALVNRRPCASDFSDPKAKGKGRQCSSLSTWVPAEVAAGPGGEMLLWDQTAALFLLDPSLFSLYANPANPSDGAKHYEPTLVDGSHEQTVQRLRSLWTRYANRSLTFQ